MYLLAKTKFINIHHNFDVKNSLYENNLFTIDHFYRKIIRETKYCKATEEKLDELLEYVKIKYSNPLKNESASQMLSNSNAKTSSNQNLKENDTKNVISNIKIKTEWIDDESNKQDNNKLQVIKSIEKNSNKLKHNSIEKIIDVEIDPSKYEDVFTHDFFTKQEIKSYHKIGSLNMMKSQSTQKNYNQFDLSWFNQIKNAEIEDI
mmetsp:Transcript_15483/g.33899  ORF Transcript_15483/g.33899 Transcript_15483/m.33899 type:complete len:205 (+) Transcript_15483:150-764(+)